MTINKCEKCEAYKLKREELIDIDDFIHWS